MITYRCNLHKMELKTSTCLECGSREHVTMKSDVYWCDGCSVPIFDPVCPACKAKGRRIATDIRPVFPEERLLLEVIEDKPFCYLKSSVWNTSGSDYVVDGRKIGFSLKKAALLDSQRIKKEYDRYAPENTDVYFKEYILRFVSCNEGRMQQIDEEALRYLKEVSDGHLGKDMFVSFSGGKDSTVTSDLVMRALGSPKILHIFGDTTLEFEQTQEYVMRFKKEHPYTPVVSSKNKEKDFEELCRLIGPPSRIMRWCCTIFKTGAITRKIDALFKGQERILAFYGIRRSESISRSKYERESDGHKIARQVTISPVIDWLDGDVWLYILSRQLNFNDAYRLGYARVGCWCCPNNSGWSEFLSKIHLHRQYTSWRRLLVDFAVSIGKPDAEVYVDTGKWKARQGGNGVAYASKTMIAFEPCATEENAFNYELGEPIEETLYELMKPFGYIDKNMGIMRLGEVYINRKDGQPVLKLQGKIGTKHLKVTILDYHIDGAKGISTAEDKVKCQLTKYQMCMGCRACEGICSKGAIKIEADYEGKLSYRIDDARCVRCGKCVNHFIGGCYMRKVLAIKQGSPEGL